jgi:hypothetical protein
MKIVKMLISFLVGFIVSFLIVINTLQVTECQNTKTGSLVKIKLLNAYNNYYIEKEKENIFEINKTEYNNTYELKDKSYFIVDKEENLYLFQAIELGDWDIQVNNEEELKKVIKTYFINKYDTETSKTIDEIEKFFENIE